MTGDARIMTMREFAEDPERAVEEVNETGSSVILTKHGKFVAVVRPLASGGGVSLVVKPRPEVEGEPQCPSS